MFSLFIPLFLTLFFFLLPVKSSFYTVHPFGSWVVVDNLSVCFLFLNFLTTVAVYFQICGKVRSVSAKLVVLVSFFLTVLFISGDWVSFFIFFEVVMIMTFFLMLGGGVQFERYKAGFYFMVYSMVGSFPLICNILFVYSAGGGKFVACDKTWTSVCILFEQDLLFFLFWYVAFLLKLPVYGFHLWLPKAHVEAPPYGSMLLAAVLLKIGVYGMLRLNLLLGGGESHVLLKCATFWGLVSIVASAVVCFRSVDVKALVAYSSIAHMNIVVCSFIFLKNWVALGWVILSIGHGLTSSKLFSGFKNYYLQTGSRNIKLTSSHQSSGGVLVLFWLLVCASNCSLPPSLTLFSEVILLTQIISNLGVFWCVLLISTLLSGLFSIFLFICVSHGQGKQFQNNLQSTSSVFLLVLVGSLVFSFFLFVFLGVLL